MNRVNFDTDSYPRNFLRASSISTYDSSPFQSFTR